MKGSNPIIIAYLNVRTALYKYNFNVPRGWAYFARMKSRRHDEIRSVSPETRNLTTAVHA